VGMCVCLCVYVCVRVYTQLDRVIVWVGGWVCGEVGVCVYTLRDRAIVLLLLRYGVATACRLLKIIGLFYRISSLLQGSFAKETYNFKEPTNGSHSITGCLSSRGNAGVCVCVCVCLYAWVGRHTLQHTATHSATHCKALQHTAKRCNTLQHTAAYKSRH